MIYREHLFRWNKNALSKTVLAIREFDTLKIHYIIVTSPKCNIINYSLHNQKYYQFKSMQTPLLREE